MRREIKQVVSNFQGSLSPEEAGNPLNASVSHLVPHKPVSKNEKPARPIPQQKEGFIPTPPAGASTGRPYVSQSKSDMMGQLSSPLSSPHTASSPRFFTDSLNSEGILSLQTPSPTSSPRLISIGINSPTYPQTGSLNVSAGSLPRSNRDQSASKFSNTSSVTSDFFSQCKLQVASSTHSLHLTSESHNLELAKLSAASSSSSKDSSLTEKEAPRSELGSHSLSPK